MSDLLSTTLLFVFALVAVFVFVRVLRNSLTEAVNARFAEAGDLTLEELETPLAPGGDLAADVERLRARVDAQAGLLRAVVYQRESARLERARLMREGAEPRTRDGYAAAAEYAARLEPGRQRG